MHPTQAFAGGATILRTPELRARGVSREQLTAAVRARQLVRIRRGYYSLPSCDAAIVQAVRVGGQLTCTSAARLRGIWVPDDVFVHIAMTHGSSRLRSPRDQSRPLSDDTRDAAELHWWPLLVPVKNHDGVVSVIDCLAHIIRCQPRAIAVAAVDSALFEGMIVASDLDLIFRALPRKYSRMRKYIDGRAMSGIESMLRLALVDAGLRVDVQVRVHGVGKVDLVVEGCIAIETDGRRYHEGVELQKRDYDRDLALALAGFTVLRFNFRQVMFQLDSVVAAVRVALANHRAFPPA